MKTFRSLRENDLLKSVQAAAKSAGIKLHHDTRNVAQRKADTDKMLANRAAAKPKVTLTQIPRKSPEQHTADMHKQISKSYSDHKPGQYVGDSAELEGDALFEGHYEDADEHMSKANDAESRGDMLAHHSHMADHHDSMSQWHEEKGRGFHADKHAEKADMYGDKATQIARSVTEAKSAEIRMYNALQKARQDREKAAADKERLRKGGEELLNPVKKPAPMEPVKEAKKMKGEDPCWDNYKMIGTKNKGGKQVPNCVPESVESVKEGMFDFLSQPSTEKKKPKLDYNAVRQSAQVRNKTKTKVFDGPDAYNKAKSHNFAEQIDTLLNPLIEAANAIDKGEYDYEGQMARTQLQTILRNSKDLIDMITDEENMPEWVQSKITLAQDYISTVRDYMQSKEELAEGTFKYHMDKAIAADQKGDTKRREQHLENARSAKFAMKSTDYAKNRELLDKHRQMSEEVVAEGLSQTLRKVVPGYAKREIDKKMDAEKFGRTDVDRDANYYRYKKIQDKIKNKGVAEEIVHTRTGANGTKYHIKQESTNDFSVHREDNGKLKHIDTYGSLNRAKQVLDNEVKEAVEQIDEISRTAAMSYVKANQEDDSKKMTDPTKRKNPTFKSTVIGKHNKGVSKNTIGFSNAMARISGHKPTTAKKPTSEEVVTEGKPGLYANIHAKRKRIAAGSGERMRKPGSKGAPTASAFKQAQKTVKENIDAGIDEGLARLISKSIKNVAAVKPSPQEKADIRLNKLNK